MKQYGGKNVTPWEFPRSCEEEKEYEAQLRQKQASMMRDAGPRNAWDVSYLSVLRDARREQIEYLHKVVETCIPICPKKNKPKERHQVRQNLGSSSSAWDWPLSGREKALCAAYSLEETEHAFMKSEQQLKKLRDEMEAIRAEEERLLTIITNKLSEDYHVEPRIPSFLLKEEEEWHRIPLKKETGCGDRNSIYGDTCLDNGGSVTDTTAESEALYDCEDPLIFAVQREELMEKHVHNCEDPLISVYQGEYEFEFPNNYEVVDSPCKDDTITTVDSYAASSPILEDGHVTTVSPFFPKRSGTGKSVLEGLKEMVQTSRGNRKKRAEKMAAAALVQDRMREELEAAAEEEREREQEWEEQQQQQQQHQQFVEQKSRQEPSQPVILMHQALEYDEDGRELLRLPVPSVVRGTMPSGGSTTKVEDEIAALKAELAKMASMMQITGVIAEQDAHVKRTRRAIVDIDPKRLPVTRMESSSTDEEPGRRIRVRGGSRAVRGYHRRRGPSEERMEQEERNLGTAVMSADWKALRQAARCGLTVFTASLFLPAFVFVISTVLGPEHEVFELP